MAVTIRLRRDTAANWTAANPTLASAEPGLETDTDKIKYGDGSTPWNSLDYFTAEVGAIAASDVTSGTFADARIAESNVTQHEAALTVTESQVSDLGTYATAAALTAHEGDAANPHAVTAAQADALPMDAGSVAVTATHTLLAANAGKVHEAVGTFTITLPNGLDPGYQAVIENHSTGAITLSATTTLQKLTSGTGLETVASVTVDTSVVVRHKGSNVWVVTGDYT